jgi:hypothetical protein
LLLAILSAALWLVRRQRPEQSSKDDSLAVVRPAHERASADTQVSTAAAIKQAAVAEQGTALSNGHTNAPCAGAENVECAESAEGAEHAERAERRADAETAPSAVPLAAAGSTELPPCATRGSVSDEERAAMRRLLSMGDLAQLDGARAFDGLLLLGAAREVLLTPAHKDKEREKEFRRLAVVFAESITWRAAARCAQIKALGLDVRLVEGQCQCLAHHYGATHGGLPVVVDLASEWRRSIAAARRLGVSAEEYATTRIFWHESCVGMAARKHAAGEGNGQFIHVIDFGEATMIGISEFLAAWPYVKASILKVSLNYGGTARRIYVARPPRLFSFGWRMLKPLILEKTRYKIVVLPVRTTQRLDDYFAYGHEQLTAIPADSLPPPLGGTAEQPIEPMHCLKGANALPEELRRIPAGHSSNAR